MFPGEAAIVLIDKEVQKTVEKLQWILNTRKDYAVSGAMRWANSSEAWFSSEESIEVGRLHTS